MLKLISYIIELNGVSRFICDVFNMKYQVVDYYDRPVHGDVVGTFDNLDDAKKCAKDYSINECDGECDVEIITINE